MDAPEERLSTVLDAADLTAQEIPAELWPPAEDKKKDVERLVAAGAALDAIAQKHGRELARRIHLEGVYRAKDDGYALWTARGYLAGAQ